MHTALINFMAVFDRMILFFIISVQKKVQPDILMFFFIAGHALAFGLIPWIPNISIIAVVRGIVGYTFGGIDIGQYHYGRYECLFTKLRQTLIAKYIKNMRVKFQSGP